jgi:hypothetical protein
MKVVPMPLPDMNEEFVRACAGAHDLGRPDASLFAENANQSQRTLL